MRMSNIFTWCDWSGDRSVISACALAKCKRTINAYEIWAYSHCLSILCTCILIKHINCMLTACIVYMYIECMHIYMYIECMHIYRPFCKCIMHIIFKNVRNAYISSWSARVVWDRTWGMQGEGRKGLLYAYYIRHVYMYVYICITHVHIVYVYIIIWKLHSFLYAFTPLQ